MNEKTGRRHKEPGVVALAGRLAHRLRIRIMFLIFGLTALPCLLAVQLGEEPPVPALVGAVLSGLFLMGEGVDALRERHRERRPARPLRKCHHPSVHDFPSASLDAPCRKCKTTMRKELQLAMHRGGS